LRRFLPSPRQLRNVIGAGAVGVIATVAFAAPAFACHPIISIKAECGEPGTVVVNWTLNTEPAGAKLTEVDFHGGTVTGDIENDARVGNAGLKATQVLKLPVTEARLDGTLTWYKPNGKVLDTTTLSKYVNNKSLADFNDKCAVPPEVPAPKVTFRTNCDSVGHDREQGHQARDLRGHRARGADHRPCRWVADRHRDRLEDPGGQPRGLAGGRQGSGEDRHLQVDGHPVREHVPERSR
jgi:hypothetical protein